MMNNRNRLLAIALVGACVASLSAQTVQPLENAHAHNDYLHEHPLHDALAHGFTGVEADIFVVDGNLLVGHDRDQLESGRTLESLYLTPLARRVQQNGGRVYKNGRRFFLLVDIKSEPRETYLQLEKMLARHADMLTTVDDGVVRQGGVTVVISGARPRDELIKSNPRYAGLDGRIADLESDAPAHLMPMISDQWNAHFTWNGDGPMPAAERARLDDIVKKAHAAGRVVRFWATPENESVWKELRSAGVDLINTDQLERLAAFLRDFERKYGSQPNRAPNAGSTVRDQRYPSHWWTPVDDKDVPDWEILPQAAGPNEVILSKRNELGLLSNFAATPFEYHGKRYASLEGFWQMMKYPEGEDDPRATSPALEWAYTREEVAQLTSFEAKKAGDLASQNMKRMGIDWVTFEGKQMEYRPRQPGEHYRLIVEATWEKVRQNPKVQQVLLSTGDLILKPDHRQEPNPPAAWRYYDILTEIRCRLQRTN